jgi:hypothetical protein
MKDPDAFHAAVNITGVFFEMLVEVSYPLCAQLIEELLDAAVVLLPQGNGGVREQALKMVRGFGHGQPP